MAEGHAIDPSGGGGQAFRAGLVQMTSGPAFDANLATADRLVRQAVAAGASFVATPENTPILQPDHAKLREVVPGEGDHPAVRAFADLARELGVWLLLGSTAVRVADDGADGRLANRSILFDDQGRIAARYDKIHMFDVAVPDGQTYRESKAFRPGGQAVVADTPWARLGLTVCYDVRFPALYRALAHAGASVLTVPAAFTQVTGRAHWHTLLRARAIETGCYVLAPAQVGEHAGGRRTYGHTLAVAPWGEVVADAGDEAPGVVTVDIDPASVQQARSWVPALQHDREFEVVVLGPR
ncbi:carbon-nitrogen hydrolase family protein [Rhodovibrio salinarum]|uniref:Amidohydrolase n=1 Tax=Rhodovibrio salinarum TaxID=1087 RepID=A0A934QIM0_9PROT|nr:carbon-nitrogen hydrolase family protein [Rhodovibrio salinarum]MBK1697125.1 amidohydrolase [Rhodovibrio salinarum]